MFLHLAAHMLCNFFNRIRSYEGMFLRERGMKRVTRNISLIMNKSTLHLYQLTMIYIMITKRKIILQMMLCI